VSRHPEIVKVSTDGLSITMEWLDPDGIRHQQTFPECHFRGYALKLSRKLLSGGADVPIYGPDRKKWVSSLKKTMHSRGVQRPPTKDLTPCSRNSPI
jgi:hypothetical protein